MLKGSKFPHMSRFSLVSYCTIKIVQLYSFSIVLSSILIYKLDNCSVSKLSKSDEFHIVSSPFC
jgi:hypothetical protein